MHRLIAAAFRGDDRAGADLYFWAYLWPRLAERLWGDEGFVSSPEHVFGRDTAATFELRCALALAALGPQPEPPDTPPWDRAAYAAMEQLRDALLQVARELDEDLKVTSRTQAD
jgi:hypothetical protein